LLALGRFLSMDEWAAVQHTESDLRMNLAKALLQVRRDQFVNLPDLVQDRVAPAERAPRHRRHGSANSTLRRSLRLTAPVDGAGNTRLPCPGPSTRRASRSHARGPFSG